MLHANFCCVFSVRLLSLSCIYKWGRVGFNFGKVATDAWCKFLSCVLNSTFNPPCNHKYHMASETAVIGFQLWKSGNRCLMGSSGSNARRSLYRDFTDNAPFHQDVLLPCFEIGSWRINTHGCMCKIQQNIVKYLYIGILPRTLHFTKMFLHWTIAIQIQKYNV